MGGGGGWDHRVHHEYADNACVKGKARGSGNFPGSNTTSSRSEVLLHYGRLRDQLRLPLFHPACLRDISVSSLVLPSLRASRNLAMKKNPPRRKFRREIQEIARCICFFPTFSPLSLFLPRYTIGISICRREMIHYRVFRGVAEV